MIQRRSSSMSLLFKKTEEQYVWLKSHLHNAFFHLTNARYIAVSNWVCGWALIRILLIQFPISWVIFSFNSFLIICRLFLPASLNLFFLDLEDSLFRSEFPHTDKRLVFRSDLFICYNTLNYHFNQPWIAIPISRRDSLKHYSTGLESPNCIFQNRDCHFRSIYRIYSYWRTCWIRLGRYCTSHKLIVTEFRYW